MLIFKNIFSIFNQAKTKSTKSISNNTWYYYNSQSDVAIVFVHGILSDSKRCWTNKSGTFWPDIICNDTRFQNPSIYLGGYHTAPDSGEYKLRDCAEELIRALLRDGVDGNPAPIEVANILFVCHSLGGNVVRYALESNASKFATKTIGLVLMASPSMGSEYADSLSGIIAFFRNGMAEQLKKMNSTLEELDNRFKTLLDEKLIPDLVGVEAVEHHSLFKFKFLSIFSPIVSKESAARYFAHHQILAGTNHSTVVKPNDANSSAHTFLYDFYLGKFKSRTKTKSQYSDTHTVKIETQQNIGSVSFANSALFDVYTATSSSYYEFRPIDSDVCQALEMCSLWLSGPSGFGKTTVIRRYISDKGLAPIEICLSSCRGRLDQQNLLMEICASVYQKSGISGSLTGMTFVQLAQLLADYSQTSHIILYLDEVPIQSGEFSAIEEFSYFISDLLDTTKRLAQNSGLRFVISSIVPPKFSSVGSTKFVEHIKQLEIPEWSKDELGKLLDKIFPAIAINLHNFTSDERELLLRESNGSPRFLKIYLRSRVTYKDKTASEILQMTKLQLIR